MPRRLFYLLGTIVILSAPLRAELRRIEVQRRDDYGTHERIIGRAFFAVDPKLPANQRIADLALAPRNAEGWVEFSGDLLYFQPKKETKSRGAVFLEVVNRGRDQALGLMSAAVQRDLSPENWSMGDRFLLEQGFAVAFLGWQFDVGPNQGLKAYLPTAEAEGIVRGSYVEEGGPRKHIAFGLSYCAADPADVNAKLTVRSKIEEPGRVIPRERWQFTPDGCAVVLQSGFDIGLYEAIYRAKNPPVAGLGLAAIRDLASYLKNGPKGAALRENPESAQRVIGFGYSQSGRFLREFVRDGFNADEKGRAAFDGIMIASAGAGSGSFNHRFASPGQAGNSVLSILRPTDVPPFNDAPDNNGLLAKAAAAGVVPKIFYTFSSTEYWARAGSLTHTTEDGSKDVPFAETSRLYFISGTPHSGGVFPPVENREGRGQQFQYHTNFAQQRWTMRALLADLDDWVRAGKEPPASRYPKLAKNELLPRAGVKFPKIPTFPFAEYMPKVWRMDYGPDYDKNRVATKEPPEVGKEFTVLVPQVDADGNDLGGVKIPEIAVPLGTYTGWNIRLPQLRDLNYLAGLFGSFEPLAKTRVERLKSGDSRLSMEERYKNRQDYLDRVERASRELVAQRLMLPDDVPGVLQRAGQMWDAIAGR
jgi:hypothetical protein